MSSYSGTTVLAWQPDVAGSAFGSTPARWDTARMLTACATAPPLRRVLRRLPRFPDHLRESPSTSSITFPFFLAERLIAGLLRSRSRAGPSGSPTPRAQGIRGRPCPLHGLLEPGDDLDGDLDRERYFQPGGLPRERLVGQPAARSVRTSPGSKLLAVLEALGDDRLGGRIDRPGAPAASPSPSPETVDPQRRPPRVPGRGDRLGGAGSDAEGKLRGLEQVRAATRLRMRGVEPDPEDRRLLDRNIDEAEAAYKAAGRLRDPGEGLERLEGGPLHRLDAVQAADAIHTRLIVSWPGSDPEAEGTALAMRPGDYWAQSRRGSATSTGSASSAPSGSASPSSPAASRPTSRSRSATATEFSSGRTNVPRQ